jgi:hypothetical protein
MRRSLLVYTIGILALGAAFAAGLLLMRPAAAEDKDKAITAAALGTPSPVVAAFPARYETEFEPDPFDQTRVRRSRTAVNDVVIVRADGTQEVRAAPTK